MNINEVENNKVEVLIDDVVNVLRVFEKFVDSGKSHSEFLQDYEVRVGNYYRQLCRALNEIKNKINKIDFEKKEQDIIVKSLDALMLECKEKPKEISVYRTKLLVNMTMRSKKFPHKILNDKDIITKNEILEYQRMRDNLPDAFEPEITIGTIMYYVGKNNSLNEEEIIALMEKFGLKPEKIKEIIQNNKNPNTELQENISNYLKQFAEKYEEGGTR